MRCRVEVISGQNPHHPLNTVHDPTACGVGLKVLTSQGASIDPNTAAEIPVFGIFAALAELEPELISERTVAGLASAHAAGSVVDLHDDTREGALGGVDHGQTRHEHR